MFTAYIAMLLSCIGLTWILMYGTILDWPRKRLIQYRFFRDLLKCAKCTGFWSGVAHLLAFSVIINRLSSAATLADDMASAYRAAVTMLVTFSFPLQSSAVCYVADWLIEKLTQDASNFLHYKNQEQLKFVKDDTTILNG